MHLNVPEHGGARKQYRRKIVWFAMGFFAPELVSDQPSTSTKRFGGLT
jgi:hypothetical protein